jgi:3-deoxy-D-manno-octulosonic-acid transferase
VTVPKVQPETVWLHAATTPRRAALCELATRVSQRRDGIRFVITAPAPDTENHKDAADGICCCTGVDGAHVALRDTSVDARAFLDRWQPDLGIWAGGVLLPTPIDHAANRNIDMVMIDAEAHEFPTRTWRWWLNNRTRHSTDRFSELLVNDAVTRDALRKLGVSATKLTVTPPLRRSALPPTEPRAAMDEVSAALIGRPVWLAAHCQDSEVDVVLNAHRNALRFAPRLMLVLSPDRPDQFSRLRARVAASGLTHANWSDGDDIAPSSQVVMTDADLGLWYRVAPVSFIGSSLISTAKGRNPLIAASLGSAVIHGPNIRQHKFAYDLLRQAGATRVVLDAPTLADAVNALTDPDLAARMALAGWKAVTKGAEMTDKLTDLILDRLDRQRAHHART